MQRSASYSRWWERALGWTHRLGALWPRRARLLCPQCGFELRRARLYRELRVCDNCGHHFPLSARKRIATLADPHTFVELEKNLATRVAKGTYARRVKAAERETRLHEAALIGTAKIQNVEVMLVVLDFRFLGGSMGAVTGEKIALAFEAATARRLPLIAVTSSGGARIQEGMVALMQMAKTVNTAQRFGETGRPFITVLSHPTTGGVYASFANLADVLLAEPRALIGFAGPRVVEVLTRQKLPSDSHRAEFLLEHGMVDTIVPRGQLRDTIGKILRITAGPPLASSPAAFGSRAAPAGIPSRPSAAGARRQVSAWESVTLARRPDRPTTLDYVQRILSDLVELHGDRFYGDDPAIVAGIARLGNRGVVVIGQERGRGAERERRRGGSAGPEGYRKAQRAMMLAAKWRLPLLSFVDTPGAASSYEAEKRGIALALARCIARMMAVEVPTIAVVIGEGGSGGALALAVADRVLMLEHAVYSVISPEGASAILYGNADHAEELSGELRLTAKDLCELGIIDELIPEPPGGAHLDADAAAARVREHILHALDELTAESPAELLQARNRKYREMGT